MPIVECVNIPIVQPSANPTQPPLIINNPQLSMQAYGPGVFVEISFNLALFGTPPAGGVPVPQIGSSPDASGAETDGANPSSAPLPVPTPPAVIPVLALIDTGAASSCIDDGIARQLCLPVINQVNVGGVGGSHLLNQYLCRLVIPQLNFSKAGAFIGANLMQGGQMHRALIGRDFLANMILVYDGVSGKAKLAV